MGVEPIPRQSQCPMLPLQHIHHIKYSISLVTVATDDMGIEPMGCQLGLYVANPSKNGVSGGGGTRTHNANLTG